MRHSIGGAWLFSISITLMMFIIAYVAITMDYSNAYQLKNDVVLVLEEYNGLNDISDKKIIAKFKKRKFTTKIDCAKTYDTSTYYEGAHGGYGHRYFYAVTSYQGAGTIEPVDSYSTTSKEAFLCIYKYTSMKKDASDSTAQIEKSFYAVSTAFGFDFPIIGNIFDYRVTGETGEINYTNDHGYNFD